MTDDARTRILRGLPTNGADPTDDLSGLEHWVEPVDWPTFLADDATGMEWLVEPIIPAGAQVAIWARAKVGKSLLALDMSAALATGRPVLGAPPVDPLDVLYVDMENPAADVRARVFDLGYTAASDLSRLHYFHIPSLPNLDFDTGGAVLAAQVARYDAKLVVVDTLASCVGGKENEADTYRGFYRFTGKRLRATGTALVRLDHGGKEREKGPRGSSAKDDDVDVVFEMVTGGDQLVLRRTRSRFAYVPAEVRLNRHLEPRLRHELAPVALPDGTFDVVGELDTLAVPLDAAVRVAQNALRESGNGRRWEVVSAALKYRREHR